jgi:hypothetical protein
MPGLSEKTDKPQGADAGKIWRQLGPLFHANSLPNRRYHKIANPDVEHNLLKILIIKY